MEKNNREQGYAIKFCVRLEEVTTNNYEKIHKAIGKDYHMRKCFSGTETL
jgi:hypothetical protein